MICELGGLANAAATNGNTDASMGVESRDDEDIV